MFREFDGIRVLHQWPYRAWSKRTELIAIPQNKLDWNSLCSLEASIKVMLHQYLIAGTISKAQSPVHPYSIVAAIIGSTYIVKWELRSAMIMDTGRGSRAAWPLQRWSMYALSWFPFSNWRVGLSGKWSICCTEATASQYCFSTQLALLHCGHCCTEQTQCIVICTALASIVLRTMLNGSGSGVMIINNSFSKDIVSTFLQNVNSVERMRRRRMHWEFTISDTILGELHKGLHEQY